MLYRQTRIGKGGESFTIYKIETMRDGVVTRPFLRRSGLDELPQLFNIFRGDMALFGPRPEVPGVDRDCEAALGRVWTQRHRVKPGILSLASVKGRIRESGRFALDVKREQAELDAQQIDSGIFGKAAILLALPKALRKGQTDENNSL